MKKCSVCLREFEESKTFCPFDGNRLESLKTGDPYENQIIDKKYQIEHKIAEGGMGNVYRATHLQLNLPVAIKILHQDMVSDYTSIERFRREAQAAMQIRHTNAITVMDFGVAENNTVYLVMEYLDGCTLRKRLHTVGHFNIVDANHIMQQVCAAVAAAHKRNIIHRDLKPDNIFLQREGYHGEEVVKVLDFGIAKLKNFKDEKNLTRQGMVVGTPHYMSPEQCYGKDVDTRSDIYSLGVILYELLTGLPPFDADSPIALAIKQASEAPPPLSKFQKDISSHINSVVMHTLEKQPENRPQTVGEFAQELIDAMNGKSVTYQDVHSIIDVRLIDEELLGDIGNSPTVLLNGDNDDSGPLLVPPLPPSAFGKQNSQAGSALPDGNKTNISMPAHHANTAELLEGRRERTAPIAQKELPAGSTSQLEDISDLIRDADTEMPLKRLTGDLEKKPLWLPTSEAKTYPVICEKCNQEVGRSLVKNSTIICPNCRTRMRKKKE